MPQQPGHRLRQPGQVQGLGVVRLTRLTVASAIKTGELVSLLEEFRAEQPIPIHAVYPHRRHLAPKVTAFIDFILEKFTPPPWEVLGSSSNKDGRPRGRDHGQ